MLPYSLMGGGDIFSSERILGNKSFTVCLLTSCIHHIFKKTALNNGYNINNFYFLHAIVAAVIIVDIINSIFTPPGSTHFTASH